MLKFFYKINLILTHLPFPTPRQADRKFNFQTIMVPSMLLALGQRLRVQGFRKPLPSLDICPLGLCPRPHGPQLELHRSWEGLDTLGWGSSLPISTGSLPLRFYYVLQVLTREQGSGDLLRRISIESGKCLFSQTWPSSMDLEFWKLKNIFCK